MAGTVWIALSTYAGLNLRGEYIRLNPSLPRGWRGIKFNFTFKENRYFCKVTPDQVKIKVALHEGKKIHVLINDKEYELADNQLLITDY
jgi:alpha,alpha-trehalose phosphorylase